MNMLSYDFSNEIREIVRQEMALNITEQKTEIEPTKDIRNQIETCEFLKITEPTIIRWRNKGKIPFMRIGAAVRYDINAVIKALEVGNKKSRN